MIGEGVDMAIGISAPAKAAVNTFTKPAIALSKTSTISKVAAIKTMRTSGLSKTVLGTYNKVTGGYVTYVKDIGARYFQVSKSNWSALGKDGQWLLNKRFLDESIDAGHTFSLSNNGHLAEEGTWFFKEIEYLATKGFKLAEDGMSMVKEAVK